MAKIAKQVRKEWADRWTLLKGYEPKNITISRIIQDVQKWEQERGWYWNARKRTYFREKTKWEQFKEALAEWWELRKERREKRQYIKLMNKYGKNKHNA